MLLSIPWHLQSNNGSIRCVHGCRVEISPRENRRTCVFARAWRSNILPSRKAWMWDQWPGSPDRRIWRTYAHLATIWYSVNSSPIESALQHEILSKIVRLWWISWFNFDRSISFTPFGNRIPFQNKWSNSGIDPFSDRRFRYHWIFWIDLAKLRIGLNFLCWGCNLR
jgi:hypothetical protein